MFYSLDILGQALVDTGMSVITYLPAILTAVVIFVLGWAAGSILGRAVSHLVTFLRVDKALHKAGADSLSEVLGFRISLAGFFGGIVKWSLIVASMMTASDILNLSQITQLFRDILVYIPQVVVAAVVLVISVLIGDFVHRLVKHSVKATGVRADFIAQISKWAVIIVVGVFPALTQLRIAPGLVEVLFTGVVFAVSLALGLSFGLGGRDAAAQAIEKLKGNQ